MTVSQWYRRGWEVFASHLGVLIGGFLIYALLLGTIELIDRALRVEGFIIMVVRFLIAPAMTVGWLLLCLRVVRGERVVGERLPVREMEDLRVLRLVEQAAQLALQAIRRARVGGDHEVRRR